MLSAGNASEPEQVNLFRLLHRVLRGRYLMVITLGVLALVGGAVTGYTLGIPKYRADAIIRVQPRLPRIMYENEQTAVTPMFASFVSTQASLVKQDRVISRAMNSEEWRRLGRPNTPEAQEEFRDSLRVNTNREAPELISATFVDVDAIAAKTGLEQTLKAYEAIFGQAESRQVTQFKIATLEARRRTLSEDISRRRQDIRSIAAEYGTENLAELLALKMDRLLEAERRIGDLELALTESVRPEGAGGTAAPPPKLDADDIALVDRTMSEYVARRRSLEELIESMRARGLGPQHPDVLQLDAELAGLQATIAAYAESWNAARAAGKLAAAQGTIGGLAESPDQLRARLQALRPQADRARAEVVDIGNKRLDIEDRLREIANLAQLLDEVNRRIDEVNDEMKVEQYLGRIEIILPEAVPSAPTADPRRKYAAIGGVLASGFVVSLFVLFGLLDRRFRYSDELADSTRRPLLACLPEVTAEGGEVALGAAHNVHRIRAMLQIASPQHRTVLVTSPSPGDGKTSVCLSLGMSFAAVGERTLLIDLDLIGRGMTTRLGLALPAGLLSALAAGTPEGSVSPVRSPNLWALPIEDGDASSPSSLRRDAIRTLLNRSAELYDCVIVDTGPILSSLEASYAASVVDGVVVVIGRGNPRSNLERSVTHLREVGAKILGVVFNRARDSDFRQSNSSTSVRTSKPAKPRPQAPPPVGKSLDPLADVVSLDLDVNPPPWQPSTP